MRWVGSPKGGETLKTLDGQEHSLTPEMLVIADAVRPVALAGVMGGAETEVTETTTNILLESGTGSGQQIHDRTMCISEPPLHLVLPVVECCRGLHHKLDTTYSLPNV